LSPSALYVLSRIPPTTSDPTMQIIAEATSLAYKSGTQDTGGKIKRVVEVWRQRNIFDLAIQDATEKRIHGIDFTTLPANKSTNGIQRSTSLAQPAPAAHVLVAPCSAAPSSPALPRRPYRLNCNPWPSLRPIFLAPNLLPNP